MQYSKPPLDVEDQATLLRARGLIADQALLVERLRVVSYYRFTGYLHPFRLKNDAFKPGTSLHTVWRRYTFDRRLRLLVMDAVERVEVAVRTELVNQHANEYGAFGYTQSTSFPELKFRQYREFLAKLQGEVDRSKETFMVHFRDRYGNRHDWPPIWVLAETMSFGSMLTMYKGVSKGIQTGLAKKYEQPEEVFRSWLLMLNTVRNTCAHHARLWNRVLGTAPKIPKERKNPDWHKTEDYPPDRVFAALIVLRYLLRCIAPQSHWQERMEKLLAQYPEIPREDMGFPKDWKQSPIWFPRPSPAPKTTSAQA